MEKGRFYKVRNKGDDYFKLQVKDKNIYIHSYRPALNTPNFFISEYYYYEDKNYKPTKITDFCNTLCFEILRAHNLEYNKDTNSIENVVYVWDANLIPGERFIGIDIVTMKGTENSWSDFFGNIEMRVDILSTFGSDLGYRGLNLTYNIYLPYTEDNLSIYQEYTKYVIEQRYSGHKNTPRKIKI